MVLMLLVSVWPRPLATLLLATRVTVRMPVLLWSSLRTGPMQTCAGVSRVLVSEVLLSLLSGWSSLLVPVVVLGAFGPTLLILTIPCMSEQLPERMLAEGRFRTILLG